MPHPALRAAGGVCNLKTWLLPPFELHCASLVPLAVFPPVTSKTLPLCRALMRSPPATSVNDHCWFSPLPQANWMIAAPFAVDAPETSTHRLLFTLRKR